jgi:hypothetical protein
MKIRNALVAGIAIALSSMTFNSVAAPGNGNGGGQVQGGGVEPEPFGRPVTHLGMTKLVAYQFVPAGSVCDDPQPDVCLVMNPSPTGTNYEFPNATSIVIPAGSTHSIVWPVFHHIAWYEFINDTGVSQIANFALAIDLTLESAALSDPSLINPDTGQPFNGSYLVQFTPAEASNMSISAGERVRQRRRLASSGNQFFDYQFFQSLGLSDKVIKSIFSGQITLHLGIRGNAKLVDTASGNFSMRLFGD